MNKKVTKLKQKREQKIDSIRKKRQKRLVIMGTVVVVVIAGIWFAYSSNFFNASLVRVKGNINISDQKVIEKSGVKRNDSLITLPAAKIKGRVLSLNWVSKAKVVRDWPDAVVLEIIERRPVAFIQTDKNMFLIDKNGFVIDEMTNLKESTVFPKIDELPVKGIKVGKTIENEALNNALTAHKGLYKGLRDDVYSITAKSVDELYFVVQGVEIVYGKAEQIKLKNKVIKTILKEKKESISTIDVRVPDRPVTRVLGR